MTTVLIRTTDGARWELSLDPADYKTPVDERANINELLSMGGTTQVSPVGVKDATWHIFNRHIVAYRIEN